MLSTACRHRMAHRKWRETKQQPSMLPGPAVPGCCWISLYFLWCKLSTRTVYPMALKPVCTVAASGKWLLKQMRSLDMQTSVLHVICWKTVHPACKVQWCEIIPDVRSIFGRSQFMFVMQCSTRNWKAPRDCHLFINPYCFNINRSSPPPSSPLSSSSCWRTTSHSLTNLHTMMATTFFIAAADVTFPIFIKPNCQMIGCIVPECQTVCGQLYILRSTVGNQGKTLDDSCDLFSI